MLRCPANISRRHGKYKEESNDEGADRAEVTGDLDARDAHVVYRDGGRIRAVVTLGRDRLGLEVEAAIERRDDAALEALVR